MNRYLDNLFKRIEILFRNPYFSTLEKLGIISKIKLKEGVCEALLKKMVKDEVLGWHFLLNGIKIFYKPDYLVRNVDYFMQGIVQVLSESFVFPTFFNKRVKLHKGEICLDIGASIGTTAILFSNLVGPAGKVYAFEPVTHAVLRKNLIANNIANVEIVPKGVSQQAGKAQIEISDYCLDSSIAIRNYTRNYYAYKREIDLTTLDEAAEQLKIGKIDFIKMDIEGAEEWALRGASGIIEKYFPKWSISSYHIGFDNQPQHPKLVALLKHYGYYVEEDRNLHIYAWKA